MMDEEERQRIEAEATRLANMDNRLNGLEKVVNRILIGLGAAALLVGTSLWEQLKGVMFK